MERYLTTCMALSLLLACGSDPVVPPSGTGGGAPLPGTEIVAEPQREGDATAGYTALVNNGYVSCGLPYSIYTMAFPPAAENLRLPGRTGKNETMPYFYTVFETPTGVDVVAPNCLVCHAALLDDKVVIGLGAYAADYTTNPAIQAEAVGAFITDPAEKLEWRKWADRVVALAPYIQAPNRGVTPADNIAAVLLAHRDRHTLAWSNEPLLPLPPKHVVPVDVPPWWRMKKKTSMFYSAAGRGDHARVMMSASALCTDNVQEAEQIDSYFPDIRSYILSLEAPAWPHGLDAQLAEQGRAVFETNCSKCHGTYGDGGEFPNRLIDVAEVGTDSVLAIAAAQLAGPYVEWFNESFYGKLGRLEPQNGYLAPPLDGIWATGPYLHNGSVPSLETLLDSSKRPKFWRRAFSALVFDQVAVGWAYEVVDVGHAAEPDPKLIKNTYDTTLLAYSNSGHTYGDLLTSAERRAVLEYLKTL